LANPSSKAPILTELFRDADLAPTRDHGVYLISYESAVRVLSGPPVEQQEFRELHWRVRTENSNPDVMMVKPTEDRVGTNDSDLLNRTKTRRILVQRPMRSDGVVVSRIAAALACPA
jgi:hypothetical protein